MAFAVINQLRAVLHPDQLLVGLVRLDKSGNFDFNPFAKDWFHIPVRAILVSLSKWAQGKVFEIFPLFSHRDEREEAYGRLEIKWKIVLNWTITAT